MGAEAFSCPPAAGVFYLYTRGGNIFQIRIQYCGMLLLGITLLCFSSPMRFGRVRSHATQLRPEMLRRPWQNGYEAVDGLELGR